MMRMVIVLCIMVGPALQNKEGYSSMVLSTQNQSENDGLTIFREVNDRLQVEDVINTERTWKISKNNVSYIFIAVIVKALLLIKLALAMLAILGNVSIMLSKLSFILSLVLTLGKYFGGISKMLKIRTPGYDGHYSYPYPGHGAHVT